MNVEIKNFLDVVADKSGGNTKIPQANFQKTGQYPIIDQGKEFIAGYTDDETALLKSTSLPVIIFGDHTKIIKYADFPFVLGADGVKVLKPSAEAHPKYIYHFLKSVHILDAGYSRHFKFLKETKIPLPPLPTQTHIAHLLDKADELRQKRQTAIKKLDDLLQATFIKMFGDPVVNDKGWELDSLENLTKKIGSGSTPKGGDSSYKDEGISLIRSLNIYDGKFSYKDLAFIDDEQADKLKNVIIEKNDVLLNITGASVARCCLVPDEVLPARVNQHVCILRVNHKISAKFLANLLITQPMKNHLLFLAGNGATREALTKLQLQSLQVPIPPLSLQTQFAHIATHIETQKAKLQAQADELEGLFLSLQQRAFDGRLTNFTP